VFSAKAGTYAFSKRLEYCTDELQSDGQALACKWQGVVNVMSTVTTISSKLRMDQLSWVINVSAWT
jgi:hypothetical protein